MLTKIVVLFMVIQLNMPTWCKWFMFVSLAITAIRCLLAFYNAGKKSK